MNSFLEKRIISKKINIGYDLELTIVEPIVKAKSICLYLSGLNGSRSSIKFFNNKCFDDKYLIAFNHRQWEDNLAKSSKNPNIYLHDIYKIILELKKNYPNLPINLIGESWGAGLSVLFINKFENIVNKAVIWNMPYKIINHENDGEQKTYKTAFDMIMTFLFNVNTKSLAFFPEQLTNNKVLLRAIRIKNKNKTSDNKVIVAAWITLRKAWKTMYKNFCNNKYNYVYVQGGKDSLMDDRKVKKLEKKYPKLNNLRYQIWSEGTHVLSLDATESTKLFDFINEYFKDQK